MPRLRVDVLTLFPGMFSGPLEESILKRARVAGILEVVLHDIRAYTTDKHHITDDSPYGGGPGMVMKPEPIFAAVEAVCAVGPPPAEIILLCPQGETFTQATAKELARHERFLLLCGHYEGVDERVREHLATRSLSIGDYVLTGGELPALVVIDAVARLLPGVLGEQASAVEDSFYHGILDYPQYTRPAVFRGWEVPAVLQSGDHARIRRWRRKEALRRTLRWRPDLLRTAPLTAEDEELLAELRAEGEPRETGERGGTEAPV